jgi:uncharacterized LabA/DUF88 family protein
MNNSNEERLKIAVFIDFDNIAIGVKQSLGRNFDVGTVLEAIKEKGQVVTKIAYGDWKRAEDFSRAMTQHAVQMVQRNLTPGGDKNGADIALALDALEMAFTRDHINAFVIVGGDSDFIALVEKLKQYDKTVFVVGGRAFTSAILQKNCHEFISYENLIGTQSGIKKTSGKTQIIPSSSSLENALPLIRRSLKILSDREVSPQLGLLKSTLLQLDSTFSERDYGVSSFRDFTQKLADAGYVNLKQVDRSLLVELKDTPEETNKEIQEPFIAPAEAVTQETVAPVEQPATPTQSSIQTSVQASEAIRVLQELLRESKIKPHWPMYLRTFKQFLRSLQPPFDEHQFGLSSTYDLVRQAHRDGLLRVERNRQGILRIYPAERFPRVAPEQLPEEATPAVTQEPESEVTAPAAEITLHLPESPLEPPAIQLEIPQESAVEEMPLTQPEAVAEETPVPKQAPKRKKRILSAGPMKAHKSESRRTRAPKEKSKDGGSSKTIAD